MIKLQTVLINNHVKKNNKIRFVVANDQYYYYTSQYTIMNVIKLN